MDDPFAQGTACASVTSSKRPASRCSSTRSTRRTPRTSRRSRQRSRSDADIVIGGTHLGRGQPDHRASTARLPARTGRVLHRTHQPGIRLRHRWRDGGDPPRRPGTRRSRSSPATWSSSRSTPRCTATRLQEDEANAYTTGQVVAAAVEGVGCAEQGECQQELIDWLRDNEVGDRSRHPQLGRDGKAHRRPPHPAVG